MSLFTPNTDSIDDFYDKGKFLLAYRISLFFLTAFTLLSVIYIINDISTILPILLADIVVVFTFFYLKITKNFQPFFWIYTISGSLIINFSLNYVLILPHYVDFIWIIVIVSLAFIGLGYKYGFVFLILNIAGIAYFYGITLNRHIEVLEAKQPLVLLGDFIEITFSLLIIGYLLMEFLRYQKHTEEVLRITNSNLEDQYALIQTKNLENETLLKEIHHRVKNNLQIVISLLRMQSMEMKSEESKMYFTEAINRIMAIFLIHQKLYGEKELSKIDLKKYIEELVNDIISISFDKNNIELFIKVNVKYLSLETIMPLGLLINELASNSLKHAFNDQPGQISIVINQTGDKFDFDYLDNGIWKTPIPDRVSFGVELIDILTDQMNGSKVLQTDKGTHYSFKLTNL